MLGTSVVKIENVKGLETKAKTRGFEINFDEPNEMGGTNTGMNPVEALLCSLGACQTIAIKMFAQAQGVDIEKVEMEVEGDLDPDGFMGNPDIRNGLQDIRLKVKIKAADKEAAKAIADLAQERCPVEDCLINTVPVTRTKIEII